MDVGEQKLYTELAGWWQLISPTSDYASEAAFFTKLFRDAGAKTILEFGAGGGNIAWYLKKDFDITITDLAPEMLEESKKQNPECEHIAGDMRTLKLDRTYDGVFIHDAVMYMLTEDDLLAVFKNAASHLKSGGTIVVAPDCIKETFRDITEHEGRDDGDRAVRYMHWSADPDPTDTVFNYDFVVVLKEKGELRTVTDRQICGIFPRATWLRLLEEAGFGAKVVEDTSTAGEEYERTEIFKGTKNE